MQTWHAKHDLTVTEYHNRKGGGYGGSRHAPPRNFFSKLRLGNAIFGELKNLDEKMLLSTPDICGLWIKQLSLQKSGPTFDRVSTAKTGTDFL